MKTSTWRDWEGAAGPSGKMGSSCQLALFGRAIALPRADFIRLENEHRKLTQALAATWTAMPTQPLANAFAPVQVGTPEATSYDLIRYAARIGGIGRAAETTGPLLPLMRPAELRRVLKIEDELATAQRRGFVLKNLRVRWDALEIKRWRIFNNAGGDSTMMTPITRIPGVLQRTFAASSRNPPATRSIGALEARLATRLQRLISTRLASSGRDTTDMAEAGRIVFCWHFCWHSRVEEIQLLAALAVRFGGGGRNRPNLAFHKPLEINRLWHR